MDWLQLASAVGVGGILGALLTKILDIVWLQKAIRKSEKTKWLREQRLRVYSEVSKEVLTLGRNMDQEIDLYSFGYSKAAEAMLLVENEALANEIEQFFTKLGNFLHENRKENSDKNLEEAYLIMIKESRSLVKKLRESLQNT